MHQFAISYVLTSKAIKLFLLVDLSKFHFWYPLVKFYIAIENGPVDIVSFPINSMVIFHCCVKACQRVSQETKLENYENVRVTDL